MTCCGGSIVGGLLAVLIALTVAGFGLAGLVLLVVGLVLRGGGRSAKGVLGTAAFFLGIALGLPMVLAVASMIRADPRVLDLDLRGSRPVSLLDKQEFPGFADTYQLDSPRIDFELPDDRSLRTRVVNTVFRAKGGQIDQLRIRGPAEDRAVAAERIRRWATQLDASREGLELALGPQDERWFASTRTPNLVIEVSLRSILTLETDSGTQAIAGASVEFLDDGFP